MVYFFSLAAFKMFFHVLGLQHLDYDVPGVVFSLFILVGVCRGFLICEFRIIKLENFQPLFLPIFSLNFHYGIAITSTYKLDHLILTHMSLRLWLSYSTLSCPSLCASIWVVSFAIFKFTSFL